MLVVVAVEPLMHEVDRLPAPLFSHLVAAVAVVAVIVVVALMVVRAVVVLAVEQVVVAVEFS